MDSKTSLKKRNRKKILSTVIKFEEISKRDLQAKTGLSWSTVSMLTSELIEEGYLAVSDKQNTNVGRRPETLKINSKTNLFIGVDVNASDIKVIVTDMSVRILFKRVYKGLNTRDSVIAALYASIDGIIKSYGKEKISAIAFSVQGSVDMESGVSDDIYYIDGWHKVPVRQIFEERYGLPVIVMHDSFCIIKAESVLGCEASRMSDNIVLVYYNSKTGIVAPAVQDGKIYMGTRGNAGEIGKMLVPAFKDGNLVPLEGVVIEQRMTEEYVRDFGAKADSFEQLAAAAFAGESGALEVFDRFVKRVGMAILNCYNMYDPELLVLGGMKGKYSSLYRDKLVDFLNKYTYENFKIEFLENDEDYAVTGAVLVAIESKIEYI